jgi:predicted nucleotidyltransferase
MIFVDDRKIPEHPYPELREVLEIFVRKEKAELGETLLGIYLVGSLASGDFDLDSDIDFLIVLETELSKKNISSLQEILTSIHSLDCYPAKHLEGSFITRNDLNDWAVVGKKKLYYFDNGSTTIEKSVHDNNWHVRWILRECGITLLGPKPKTFLRPIQLDGLFGEMKASMFQIFDLFAASINQPLNYWNSQFGQSFTVLTYCRILHTLHTGEVRSKKVGAKWAMQTVDPEWSKLIDQAWNDRKGVRFGVKIGQRADKNLLDETLEFMKYALARSSTKG